MAGQSTPRHSQAAANGAPTLTPLGHYAGRPNIPISRTVTLIGSRQDARLHLHSSTVSKAHCLIVNTANGAYVRDLASRTKVIVNGRPARETDLNDGDKIQIGKFEFQFNAGVNIGRGKPMNFDPAPPASLNVEGGEMPLPIEDRVILIGRRTICDVPLTEESVSTAHAVILERNGKRYVRDLGSRTGTFVNGRQIQQQAELAFGDELRIGETTMTYAAAADEAHELDNLISPALGAADLDASPLDDLAAAVATTDAGSEDVSTLEAGPEGLGVEGVPLEEPPTAVAASDQAAEAPAEDAAAAIEEELGLSPELDARSGWRSRLVEAEEQPELSAAPAAPEEEISTAEVPAAEAPAAEAEAPQEQEPISAQEPAEAPEESLPPLDMEIDEIDEIDKIEAIEPPSEVAEEAAAEDVVEVDAEVKADRDDAEQDAQNVPTAAKPLPGVTELADLARAESPVEKDVESTEEEIKPVAAVADTADVNVIDEENIAENIYDEAPLSPVALEEPAIDEPDFEVGEVPPLELADAPRDAESDAAITETPADETGLDELELSPVLGESLLPEESQIGTDEPADATLELALPTGEEPSAPPVAESEAETTAETTAEPTPEPTAEITPESIDEAERGASRRRRSRNRKGEPVEISLPEPTAQDQPAREEPARAEPAHAPPEAEPVEVIDHTQPTPESAQSLEDAVADILAEPSLERTEESVVDSAELTDSAFGRNVESFAGESSGPLVESRDEEIAEPEAIAETVEQEAKDEAEISVEPVGESWLQDTPFAAEEPAAVALEGDTAGQDSVATSDDEAAAEALGLEALSAEANAPTIDAAPEEIAAVTPPPLHQQTVEDVAKVEPPPVEPSRAAEPPPAAEPVVEAPKSAPQIDLTGWGPNQEHFLGGMPLQLNDPAQPPKQRAPHAEPIRPAADARPIPQRSQKGSAPRHRSPFDLTPGDVPTEDSGRTIPPYSGKTPQKGRVTTGFDGLAMPPVRQTDVFSQMATPASFVNGILGAEDVFGGRTGAIPAKSAARNVNARHADEPARKQSAPGDEAETPRPGQADDSHPEPWNQDEATEEVVVPAAAVAQEPEQRRARAGTRGPVPPTLPPDAAHAYPAPPRKRRWFGLRGLLVLMLACMTAAVAGIYAFVPPRAIVQGSLAFRNFTALNELEQRQLKSRQQQLLAGPALRENAQAVLRTNDPDATPGFLNEGAAFSRTVAGLQWNGGTLVLRRDGTSPRLDQARVLAVLTALYQSNGDIVEDSRKLRGRVDALTDAHAKAQQRVAELKSSIDRTRAAAEGRPEPAEIAATEEEAARLETAWSEAVATVKNIEVDLKRMREALPASPQPAGTAAVPVVDPQLVEMERELKDLNDQIAQLQRARSTRAQDLHQQLEAAMKAFDKSVVDLTTQGAPAGPELAAYVAEAQKLQRSTRELTARLIDRQQQQTEKLTELKAGLDAKREARRGELVSKDPDLKKWNDELAIAQRQHSAAVSAGLANDAEEYGAHVETLKKMIGSRQALIGEDAFYANAIGELEKLIAETTRSIESDRQATEAAFEENQKAIAQAQPPAETLTAEQLALTGALTERLAAVAAARRTYTQALGAADDESDAQMQKLRDEAATLAGTVAERKQQLAATVEKTQLAAKEQDQMAALKQRESELAAAREAEAAARAAWAASQKKLAAVHTRVADAREAGEKIDQLSKERDALQAEVELNLRTLEAAQAQLAKKVDPISPEEKDVRIEPGTNVRPTYSLIAVGAIAAVFTILILLTVQSDRSAAAARSVGEDDWGDPAEPLLPVGDDAAAVNGNGQSDSHDKPGRHEGQATVPV